MIGRLRGVLIEKQAPEVLIEVNRIGSKFGLAIDF